MTENEITNIIETTLENLPEHISGNEASHVVSEKLKNMMGANRQSIVKALRSYISFRFSLDQRSAKDAIREARIWMAFEIAESLSLIELRHDIEVLITDVHTGKIFLPVHEKSVKKYLQNLERMGIDH